jgi:hypothetical protein
MPPCDAPNSNGRPPAAGGESYQCAGPENCQMSHTQSLSTTDVILAGIQAVRTSSNWQARARHQTRRNAIAPATDRGRVRTAPPSFPL